jgi:hypothetical protein
MPEVAFRAQWIRREAVSAERAPEVLARREQGEARALEVEASANAQPRRTAKPRDRSDPRFSGAPIAAALARRSDERVNRFRFVLVADRPHGRRNGRRAGVGGAARRLSHAGDGRAGGVAGARAGKRLGPSKRATASILRPT